MSLFPRFTSTFQPMRHEFGPFFNLFNDTFSELQRLSNESATTSRTFAPRFDIKESADQYVLEGELPGIKQKDVTIEFVDDHTLTIKGRTETVREEGVHPSDTTKAIEGAAEATSTDNTAGADTASTPAGSGETPATAPSENKELTTSGGAQDLASPASPPVQHTYWLSERSVGEFARSFAFPGKVDQENVRASLKDGILNIVVPKMLKQNKGKKVTIEDA